MRVVVLPLLVNRSLENTAVLFTAWIRYLFARSYCLDDRAQPVIAHMVKLVEFVVCKIHDVMAHLTSAHKTA